MRLGKISHVENVVDIEEIDVPDNLPAPVETATVGTLQETR